MAQPLWRLDDVLLAGGPLPRLSVPELEIGPGVTAVLGPSGAGKTSLLNLLVGFELPSFGKLERSISAAGFALPLFWVPQDGGLWPHVSARGHLAAASGQRRSPQDAELLAAFDLASRADEYPARLSMGERARLAVARALAARAAALVMDEPFAHVDQARVGKFWQAVREHLRRSGASLVFAAHSPEVVLSEAQRVVCLSQGRVLYAGEVLELYWRPASLELAQCLGETNWLTPEQAQLWLAQRSRAPRCYRPEQLSIQRAEGGAIVVEQSRFKGSVAEVRLRHEAVGESRWFFHRPPADGLQSGDRVSLHVRGPSPGDG